MTRLRMSSAGATARAEGSDGQPDNRRQRGVADGGRRDLQGREGGTETVAGVHPVDLPGTETAGGVRVEGGVDRPEAEPERHHAAREHPQRRGQRLQREGRTRRHGAEGQHRPHAGGDSSRPVTALDIAEAATPKISRTPRAATGWWKLSRMDGQSRPRTEPGRATLRYARQAREKGGTAGTSFESLSPRPHARRARQRRRAGEGSLCRRSGSTR